MKAGKRSGRYGGSSSDAFGRRQTSHDQAPHRDWASEINAWPAALSQHGSGFHPGRDGPPRTRRGARHRPGGGFTSSGARRPSSRAACHAEP
ncbi:hypothetical protein AB0G15_16675 [Streptosporangium sp. NPDC023825]|uniref:hypothetical protein n=1 Tax=Streptosporangium sp. NPDC023825 TaxID=3154909 RepID=UPI00343B0129